MKKLFLIVAILPLLIIAQTLPEKALKKIDKSSTYFDNGEYEKSEEILKKLSEEYPRSSTVWDKLAKTQFYFYLQQKKYDNTILGGNMTITVKDKDGKEKPGNDSLANAFKEMLEGVKPSKKAFTTLINTCREGTRYTETAEYCSILLRINLIDEETDANVSDSAYHEFNLAEKAFMKNNYSVATEHYKKAIAIDSTFFKARLYLGDAYFVNKQYTGAIKYFKEATVVKPNLQEGWKYLTDAYYSTQAYDEAFKSCMEGILVYPDIGMFTKLENAGKAINKNFKRHWIERGVFPNLKDENLAQKLKDKDWQTYVNALNEIKPFCNNKGMVTKTNSLTTGIYAEVYAFEKMINSSNKEFDFAKQMQLKGYLDCYVLFSLYHFDLNTQYQSFLKQNKNKLKNYIQLLCEI